MHCGKSKACFVFFLEPLGPPLAFFLKGHIDKLYFRSSYMLMRLKCFALLLILD